jgi:hypothetical protein
MNILLSVMSERSLKMRSQIFFARSLVFWGIGHVPGVCYEQGVKIRQGLSMQLNPMLKVPLNESQ